MIPLIRTVIVDDSAFVRKVVTEMLSSSPLIEVVGTARNGEDALLLIESLNPDVVTCDLNMPVLDGVAFVKKQMARRPLPILLLSASPEDGALVLDALSAGAIDFIQKPTSLATEQLRDIRRELVEKVKAAAGAHSMAPPLSPVPAIAISPKRSVSAQKIEIVLLGISTGGPQALRYMIPQLPPDFPVPLVIVLHMPLGYTALFAEKLAQMSRLPVREASEGCLVHAGEVMIAPAGRHLYFKRRSDGTVVVQLSHQPTDKPHRPSVDILFQSGAEVYGDRALAVVMTGMGDDGRLGAALVKARGGLVLTESEESCIIYGMPRSVVESGLSDQSVTLQSMVGEIIKRL